MASDMNNNPMESFNGNTVRLREEATCCLKREDSAILTGLRLYRNHVRPHQGLPGKTTPGEAAGIRMEGDSKWKTIIQNAAKQLDAEGRRGRVSRQGRSGRYLDPCWPKTQERILRHSHSALDAPQLACGLLTDLGTRSAVSDLAGYGRARIRRPFLRPH